MQDPRIRSIQEGEVVRPETIEYFEKMVAADDKFLAAVVADNSNFCLVVADRNCSYHKMKGAILLLVRKNPLYRKCPRTKARIILPSQTS
jgi:hypothetical protein